jgi:hypothetical protein
MTNQSRVFLVVGTAAVLGFTSPAHSSQFFDNQRGELAARVATQNTFQHNDAQSINWVQWRNEVRFDLRYDLIQQQTGGLGPLALLKFNILWRGRYDAAYDLKDSYKNRDYNRGDFEFPEGRTPRELFLDFGFGGALKDLSLRIGKQQVVWGESDLFRSLDVVNPLDLRQNGAVGEDFSEFRQPLWIFKALYDMGSLASFWNEAGLESFFSPNGRPQGHQTNVLIGETWKISTNQSVVNVPGGGNFNFNRNMSLPFAQVRHPWEFLRVGARERDSPAVVQNADGSLTDFMYRIKDDVPSSEFSTAALMAGLRLIGTTYGNTYFTLNYLFKKSDAASAATNFSQLFNPNLPGTGAAQPDVSARAVNAIFTPDLNGNGIPDGQDQQILNCLQSKSPTTTGFANGLNPLGNVPVTTPGAAEFILDPRAANPAFTGAWHGSVYSDPAHPELATGVKPGNFGVPLTTNGRPTNALNTNHVAYDPVLPVPGDGLVHNSACLDIPVFHAWTHIIGMSATYNDYNYTGLVFRLEQSFSTKEPRQFSNLSPERLLIQKNNPGVQGDLAVPQAKDFETRARRYVQVWRSMVGADWTSSIASTYAHKISNELVRSLLSDQWIVSFQFLNEYDSKYNQVDHSGSFTDRFQQFTPFFTLSGSGFFVHQTFRPTWAFAFDANQLYPLVFLQGAYFLTPKLEMRLGEVMYLGSARAQDNGGLSYYSDRDTFYVRLTYFLA